MRFRAAMFLGLLTASYVAAGVACGARSELKLPNPSRPAQGGDGGGPPDCVVFNSSTELAPLDVFIMLDRSGSMDFPTGQGIAKWYAVRDAFDSFFYDPESRGINVGLGFFPIINEFIPELCEDDGTCGVVDACKPFRTCPTTGSQCITQADCDAEGFGDPCTQLGRCSLQQVQFCIPGFQECQPGLGTCEPVGSCENRFTCESAAYEPPFVGLGLLPDHGFNLLGAFNEIGPEGGTPTLPALTGVVDHAIAHSRANPDSNVIVVLATDGVPTACDSALDEMDPQAAVQNLVDATARGTDEGIQTFVIGVFSQDEQAAAEASLTAIAQAGGTGSAFIVNSSGGVTTDFREALNQVRLSAKSCEFELVKGDDPIDYGDVWVRITRGGDEVWIRRVDGIEACDPNSGGFF